MTQIHPVSESGSHHEISMEEIERSRSDLPMIQEILSSRDMLVQNLELDASMADLLNKLLDCLNPGNTEPQQTNELHLCEKHNNRGTLLHIVTSAILHSSEHQKLYMALFDCILWAAKNYEGKNPTYVILDEEGISDMEYFSVYNLVLKQMHVPLLRKILDEYVCIPSNDELDVSFLMNTPGNDTGCLANCVTNCCSCIFIESDIRLQAILNKASRRDAVEDIRDIVSIRMLMTRLSYVTTTLFIFAVIWHLFYMSVISYICFDRLDPTSNQTRLSTSVLLYTVGLTEPVFLAWQVTTDALIVPFLLCCWFCDDDDDEMNVYKWVVVRSLKRLVFFLPYMVMLWIVLYGTGQSDSSSRYYIISLTLLYGWMLTFRLSFGIESIHFFTEVLVTIIRQNVTKILVVYSIFLIGFSVAIHVQFLASTTVLNSYKTLAHTLFLMFNIMMGMGDLFTDKLESSLEQAGIAPVFSKILYISYLVFVSLILLNLLIAMMNTSYSQLKDQHSQQWKVDATLIGLVMFVNFPFIAKPFCSTLWKKDKRWLLRKGKESGSSQAIEGKKTQRRNIENQVTEMLGVLRDTVTSVKEMDRKLNRMLQCLGQDATNSIMSTETSHPAISENVTALPQ